MAVSNSVFHQLPSLTNQNVPLSGSFLRKQWFKQADARYLGESLNYLIELNQENLSFLGVQAKVKGTGKLAEIGFQSSNFIGAISLISPATGKQIGDFVVTPRYVGQGISINEWAKVVDLLEFDIQPEFASSLPLLSQHTVRPPEYLICSDYIHQFSDFSKRYWTKFRTTKMVKDIPHGNIDWQKKALSSHDPRRSYKFPQSFSILTVNHEEFCEFVYVYDLAKRVIASYSTPPRIKGKLLSTIRTLDQRLYTFHPKEVRETTSHRGDFPAVRELKILANKVLHNSFDEICSWRIDGNILFEKFILHIFSLIERELTGALRKNPKFYQHLPYPPAWTLSYLEPDGVYSLHGNNIIIDAKYKSHMLNVNSRTEELVSSHRSDLHQILAYSSFYPSKKQLCILVYPSSSPYYKTIEYGGTAAERNIKVLLFGIPMQVDAIPQSQEMISKVLQKWDIEE